MTGVPQGASQGTTEEEGVVQALDDLLVAADRLERVMDLPGHDFDVALMDSRVAADQAHDAAMRQR